MAGIYVHIPFCKQKCGYCDFYSCTIPAIRNDFLTALKREIVSCQDFFGNRKISTVYLGGGTPSVLPASDIRDIIATISKTFPGLCPGEITVEANPDDITAQYAAELKDSGVNRVSLGIQSFDDSILSFMNRRHDAAKALDSIRLLRDAGIGNISIDLIYGIPEMNISTWSRTLNAAARTGVEHISAYHLAIEEGTPFHKLYMKDILKPVAEEDSVLQYRMLTRKLSDVGFRQYEISNFAREGFESRHNSSYWNGQSYLGLGPSAHSFDGIRRRWVSADVQKYVRCLDYTELYQTETLTSRDRYNEFVMTSLRTVKGAEAATLKSLFGHERYTYFTGKAQKHIKDGRMEYKDGFYKITPGSFLVSDSLISDFFI